MQCLCGHKWIYTGIKPKFCGCPSCRTTLSIRKHKIIDIDPTPLTKVEQSRYQDKTGSILLSGNNIPISEVPINNG